MDEAVQIAQKLRTAYGPKLKDFKDALEKGVSLVWTCASLVANQLRCNTICVLGSAWTASECASPPLRFVFAADHP